MFKAALFLTAPNRKQPKYTSPGEWVKTLWYVHVMYDYLATKRNKLLIHSTTWMDFKGIIMLREKKPISKGYILYDAIYLTFLK